MMRELRDGRDRNKTCRTHVCNTNPEDGSLTSPEEIRKDAHENSRSVSQKLEDRLEHDTRGEIETQVIGQIVRKVPLDCIVTKSLRSLHDNDRKGQAEEWRRPETGTQARRFRHDDKIWDLIK